MHGVDVVHPLLIDCFEQDHTFKLAHDIAAQHFFLGFVLSVGAGLDALGKLFRRKRRQLVRSKELLIRRNEHTGVVLDDFFCLPGVKVGLAGRDFMDLFVD